MQTVAGDGVIGIKRRRRDLSSEDVGNLETGSGRGRLKEDLESSTSSIGRNVGTTNPELGCVSSIGDCCGTTGGTLLCCGVFDEVNVNMQSKKKDIDDFDVTVSQADQYIVPFSSIVGNWLVMRERGAGVGGIQIAVASVSIDVE
ncbi:hypothetical protein Tco_0098069 [Tanacetum coccineum]